MHPPPPDGQSQDPYAPEGEFAVYKHSDEVTLPDRQELHALVGPVKEKIIQLMNSAHNRNYINWKKSITDLYKEYINPGSIFLRTGPSVKKARQKAMSEIQALRSIEITCIQDISKVTSFDPATFYVVLSSMDPRSQHMILSLVAKHRFQLPFPPQGYKLKGLVAILVDESRKAMSIKDLDALEPQIDDDGVQKPRLEGGKKTRNRTRNRTRKRRQKRKTKKPRKHKRQTKKRRRRRRSRK
jgi:hypothetical protein